MDPPDLRQWLYIREDRTVDVDGVLGEASKAAARLTARMPLGGDFREAEKHKHTKGRGF